jgi:hypothetical protein
MSADDLVGLINGWGVVPAPLRALEPGVEGPSGEAMSLEYHSHGALLTTYYRWQRSGGGRPQPPGIRQGYAGDELLRVRLHMDARYACEWSVERHRPDEKPEWVTFQIKP